MSSIFSKIIAGEIPGRFVWSDDRAVAFLDVSPLTMGHTLVVPREEIDRWTDLSEDLSAHLFSVAQKIGRAQVDAFGAARAGVIVQGFEVPHTHIHVFPTNGPGDFDPANRVRDPKPQDLDAAARDLRAALRAAGAGESVPED